MIYPKSALNDGIDYCIAEVLNDHGGERQAKANAAFIVEACNQYDALKHRADLVEPLVEALRASQAALAMMTAPKSIMATSTAQAYAHAYAAECKARTALQAYEAAQ
jgi:hypothetical protein